MTSARAAKVLSRRERMRALTDQEVRQSARKVLVEQGPEGLALRAVAREVGMSAAGLYRYFASRDHLVEAVVADIRDDLGETLKAARDAAPPGGDAAVQLLAVARAMRQWAVTHPAEFSLSWGGRLPSQLPDADGSPADASAVSESQQAAIRLFEIWIDLFRRVHARAARAASPDPALVPHLDPRPEWREVYPPDIPSDVAQRFLSSYIRLYGVISMEVFGHLQFTYPDDQLESVFEAELHAVAEELGVADVYAQPDAGAPSAEPAAAREERRPESPHEQTVEVLMAGGETATSA